MLLHDYLEFFARETLDHSCAEMDERKLAYLKGAVWSKFGPLRHTHTTDYNNWQLIKSGVMIGNVTQAIVLVVVDCLRGTHNPSVPGSSPGGPTN